VVDASTPSRPAGFALRAANGMHAVPGKDVLDVVGRTQRGEGSGRREMGWRTLLQHRLSQWLSMASVVSVVWAETHMLLGGMR